MVSLTIERPPVTNLETDGVALSSLAATRRGWMVMASRKRMLWLVAWIIGIPLTLLAIIAALYIFTLVMGPGPDPVN